MKDLNVYPYYDNSEDEYVKKYKEILFVPGRAIQARELSGIQTLRQIQNIENWNTVYKHGSIVDGCDITVITVNDVVTANLSSGKFYYDGRVLLVEEQDLTILGTGTENLGFYIEETFITSNDDNTLLDRAYGVSNYGLPGADRLKIEVKFIIVKDIVADPRPELETYEKYEDEDGVNKIWNLIDGEVQNYIRKPDYTLIAKTLAQRTFDESGHYLVEGMRLETEEANDTNEITITVTPGICYVFGYDNRFIVAKSVDVSKSLETKQYLNEPHTFTTGTYLYQLIYPYVNTDETITVTAIIKKTIEITRGSGDYDTIENIYGFTYTSIESIVEIPGYTETTDYELLNDQVHWLTGSRPGGGVDYEITFRYYKSSVRDTDFTIILDPYQTLDIYYISWLGVDDPDNDTNFLIDYYVYLARTDLVSIDKDGNIIVKTGSSTDYDETKVPPFNNDTLPLGWIKFLPGKDYDSCISYEYNFRRSTMYDLHNLRERVDSLEENLAYLALEREVKEGESTALMTGLFTDAFENLYRANVEHADYNVATNLLQGECLLQSVELSYTIDRDNDVKTNVKTWTDNDNIVTGFSMQYTSTQTFFEQNLKSDTMNLNPYGFILNQPVSKLNPASDSWVKEEVKEKTIVNNQVTETNTNIHQLQWVSLPNNVNQLTTSKLTSIGEKVSSSKVNITEKLITLARNIEITVYGKNFEPLSKVTCVCGGIYAPLTATFPYLNEFISGNSTGKIIVAANGTFKGTFTIPQRVKSGNIKVEFIDSNKNTCTVVFKSNGIQKIIENQTTITKTFSKTIDVYKILPPNKSNPIQDEIPDIITENPKTKPALNPNIIELTKDPLAQSFIFKDDKVLISMDLWFGTKADDAEKPQVEDDYYNTGAFSPIYPAILTIGFMKNGFPDPTQILHLQEIYPEEITTSLYGDTPTNIVLSKPVFLPALKDFYISIGSKSTEYTVFVAVMGEQDIETENIIMKQAYQDGSLFSSSNGITWTAVQEKDLAIRLYEGVYPSTASIVMENVSFPYSTWTGYGRFLFLNEFIEPPRTKAFYYYSTDSGTTWKLFNPADEIALSFLGTNLKVKIEMETDISTLTPIIEYDNNLIFFKFDITEQGQYRTKPVEDIPAYNSVKLIIDESVPSGTSLLKEFSTDGNVWFRLVQDAIDSRDIGKNFYKNIYLFEYDLLQKLSLPSSTGFSVGDNVKYVGSGTNTAKITSIDGSNVYVLLNDDGETRFLDSHQLTNGTTTKDIDTVEDYTSDPTWPTDWTGRVLFESTSVFKSPVIKNYRSIMKII